MKQDTKHYLECSCSDMDHLLRITTSYYEDFEPEIILEFRVPHYLTFWQRLKAAWGYLRGHNPQDMYDSVILAGESVEKLKLVLQDYNKCLKACRRKQLLAKKP